MRWEALWSVVNKMGREFFWAKCGVCGNYPCRNLSVWVKWEFGMVELFPKTLGKLWSSEVLLVHLRRIGWQGVTFWVRYFCKSGEVVCQGFEWGFSKMFYYVGNGGKCGWCCHQGCQKKPWRGCQPHHCFECPCVIELWGYVHGVNEIVFVWGCQVKENCRGV